MPVQLYPEQQFPTLDDFRATLRLYAAETSFAAPRIDSNTTRSIVHCGRGKENGKFTCRFLVTCSYSKKKKCFVVSKKANVTHTCHHHPEVKNRTIHNNHEWLRSAVIRDLPPLTRQTTAKTIKTTVAHHERVGVSAINDKAVRRVRASLLGDTKLEEIRNYHQLPDYFRRIHQSNPDTHSNLKNTNEGQFRRLFICPPTSRWSFQHMRPIVAVDGTFGKARF